jgi:anti-sigma factor RsiW
MNCREREDFILSYIDGLLAPEAARELEVHFAACPSCSAFLADQRRIDSALREHLAPPAAPNLAGRVLSGLGRQPSAPGWTRWLDALAGSVVSVLFGLAVSTLWNAVAANPSLSFSYQAWATGGVGLVIALLLAATSDWRTPASPVRRTVRCK